MSIFRKLFQRKLEIEAPPDEDSGEDEVYVRDASGRMVKLEVPDDPEEPKDGEANAADH